jgi:hypothetical protein
MSISNVNKAILPLFIQRNLDFNMKLKKKISGDYIALNEALFRMVIWNANKEVIFTFENSAFVVEDSFTRSWTMSAAQTDQLDHEQIYSYDIKVEMDGVGEYWFEGPITPSIRRS